MSEDKRIHFGAFLRMKRTQMVPKMSLNKFAAAARTTERTLFRIERMAVPVSYDQTIFGIANVLGLSTDELDRQWRSTPAPIGFLSKGKPPEESAVESAEIRSFRFILERAAKEYDKSESQLIQEAIAYLDRTYPEKITAAEWGDGSSRIPRVAAKPEQKR